ncbi:MAG: hypothetical protein ACREQR_01575 [Candidatus Binataceae bacterium]
MIGKTLGSERRACWRTLLVAAVATVATLWTSAAMATITQGDFSVFGFFETREEGRWGEGSSNNNGTPTTLTHPTPTTTLAVPGTAATENGGSFDFNHWDLDEMRQLADIRPDYHFVKNYKFLGRFDTLLLKDADFFAFYRPWYDAFGTLKGTGRAETNRDWSAYSQSDLQQQYFRDDLHEYYAQLNFTDNFSARIGKQEVIWSEADALSGTEITNSIDTTYHGVYGAESAEDQRKNLRMIKLNYILPDFLKTANNEIEAFVIPGDYQGNGINVNDTDARNPWVIPAATGKVGYNQNGQAYRNQSFLDLGGRPMLFSGGLFFDDVTQIHYTTPTNSLDNSEFGVRLSSLLPIGNGLQASFIYLYEARDEATGLCSQCTGADAGPGFTQAAPGVFTGIGHYAYGPPRAGVPKAGTIKILTTEDFRRNNFFGLTGTYYDKDLTDIVYRYDTLYAPRVGVGTASAAGYANGPGDGIANTEQARFILAGDRPTYIPWISKQHTFLTFQYVNTWYPDRPNNAVPSIANVFGKVREDSNFAFLAATNWLMNGQLTATNVFQWDIDDNCGAFTTTNIYRYSRNVLFGVNSAWFLGRSGRYTDPFLYSRSQRESLLEFTASYEI